jgi:hypothetical protein
MSTWKDVQVKKAEMRKEAIAQLSDQEKEVLMKVLELEWENRHLKTPDVRRPLRNFIKQVIQ